LFLQFVLFWYVRWAFPFWRVEKGADDDAAEDMNSIWSQKWSHTLVHIKRALCATAWLIFFTHVVARNRNNKNKKPGEKTYRTGHIL
jgi:hypothetical protein